MNTLAASIGEMPHASLRISRKLLMAFYLVIPFSLLCVGADMYLLDGALKKALPMTPDKLFWASIFLNLPHIVASSFSFFDREYFICYRRRMAVGMSIIVAGIGGVYLLFGMKVTTVLFVIWTVKHVVGQQLGISLMLLKAGQAHGWKWIGLLIGILIHLSLIQPRINGVDIRDDIGLITGLLLVVHAALSFRLHRRGGDPMAIFYLWLNHAMIASAWLMYIAGYSFFVVLIPRIVHDMTAFAFYITHDINRERQHSGNALYRPFVKFGVPVAVLCPLLAIVLAWPITYYNYFDKIFWVKALATLITAFHYYTDSFVWKRDSLHRQYVRFK